MIFFFKRYPSLPGSPKKKWIPVPTKPTSKKNAEEGIWFNPPFSCNIKTNIGSKLLRLLDYHFPKEHPLHPLINRNTVKISYRCLPNLGKVISKHNSKVMKESLQTEENLQPAQNLENVQSQNCNCRNKEGCPLMGQCQERGLFTRQLFYQRGKETKHT